MDEPLNRWTGRAILHVDMDAFFASVEQLDHPEWRGRPVIVGGSPEGRGVVSAASYEARVFGIHSAMPSAQAARLCPHAVWARGNFDRYHELSRQVCEILASVSPRVQQVSIDEAYVDATPSDRRPNDPVELARSIQQQVDALGLSCSIGVAASKTVAKIASDHQKPHGITVVLPGAEAAFLAPLHPLWERGSSARWFSTVLQSLGITELPQNCNLPHPAIARHSQAPTKPPLHPLWERGSSARWFSTVLQSLGITELPQ
ncbi:MAG: DNA polymerase IV, partial [Coriobacteriia bacterium]|nr:DNA polymerase IV [Coriobacteriia bacterium]